MEKELSPFLKMTILLIVVSMSFAACSKGSAVDPSCSSADRRGWITCREAITIARTISVTEHVSATDVKASVGDHAVGEGQMVPAWVITSVDAVFSPPSGGTCILPSYAVIVEAATGRLLAWDAPPFGECNLPKGT
jgi:hypothetical protein